MSTPHEHMEMQDEQHARRATRQTAQQMAAKQTKDRVKNPNFLQEMGQVEVDSEKIDWLEDEFPALLAGAHVKGNRAAEYGEQAWLLDPVAVEEFIAARSPGRCLRQHERLWALAQGLRGTEQYPDPTDAPGYEQPLASDERRVLRQLAEASANNKSLSAEGKGFDGATKVQTETKTIQEEEEEKGLVGRAANGVFG